ncbi:beta-glucuronosyltransferase GlcAT14B isoform X2 [Arachis ipaensis]|uniref:beta-glucuronosyltransferase GlcAT14B isoform X2 n=1 Tax=Arachis ipaensis TaxID=130454 RepID=UPI000A2B6B1D|nr:beta-glucuronosyltransferase GlcAT14B isoform X2 [Arachis ipaensis]
MESRMNKLKKGSIEMEKKWLYPLIMGFAMCIFFAGTSFNMGLVSSIHNNLNSIFFFLPSHRAVNRTTTTPTFVEKKISPAPAPSASATTIPRMAYLISGSKGDLDKLWRTLFALYHPLNQYVLHLDLESPLEERLELSSRVENQPIFKEVGNVFVIPKANMVTYRGPTMVANTLHACAILLKRSKDWDWFINLSASDYPLVTQDGSAWMVLSRAFVEYVVWGWDNLPRTLLMYYANFVSSPEGYFQTVICNNPELAKTIVNSDLHYISWDIPPKQHPHVLSINDTEKMIASNAAFARKFRQDDPVLDVIDKKLLHRRKGLFTLGGWCSGKPKCTKVGDKYRILPGKGSHRLRRLINRETLVARFGQNQCT